VTQDAKHAKVEEIGQIDILTQSIEGGAALINRKNFRAREFG